MKKRPALDLDGAETIAIQALAFLAGDPARLGGFLAATGIGPAELKAAAGTAELQAAVLDHLLIDESALLVFAAENAIAPEQVGFAHALLAREAHLRGET